MTLIDAETAAVALNVSARRIRQLVSTGKLTNYGTTRRILLDLAEVRDYR